VISALGFRLHTVQACFARSATNLLVNRFGLRWLARGSPLAKRAVEGGDLRQGALENGEVLIAESRNE
jgi:hypothetical protein